MRLLQILGFGEKRLFSQGQQVEDSFRTFTSAGGSKSIQSRYEHTHWTVHYSPISSLISIRFPARHILASV